MVIDDGVEDTVDDVYVAILATLLQNRYAVRPAKNRSKPANWVRFLHDHELVNEVEFLTLFRMSRRCFHEVYTLLNSNHDGKLLHVHLLCFLKFIGTCGSDASATKIGILLGIGYGTVRNFVDLTMDYVLKIKPQVIFWPEEEERKSIANVCHTYGFVNCIGIVDGTLFPLEYKPGRDGEDYNTRKGGYAVHGLVFCDHRARIRALTLGWPGSVHDNRAWQRSKVMCNKDEHFNHKQYLLGDSAFKPSDIVIPAFKKPVKVELDYYKKKFNTQLAKLRIKSEHCIGLLKGRFSHLKKIRIKIKGRKDIIKINRIITSAAILHNIMIKEDYPDAWKETGECDLNDDDDVNKQAFDDQRRQRIFAYIIEKED